MFSCRFDCDALHPDCVLVKNASSISEPRVLGPIVNSGLTWERLFITPPSSAIGQGC